MANKVKRWTLEYCNIIWERRAPRRPNFEEVIVHRLRAWRWGGESNCAVSRRSRGCVVLSPERYAWMDGRPRRSVKAFRLSRSQMPAVDECNYTCRVRCPISAGVHCERQAKSAKYTNPVPRGRGLCAQCSGVFRTVDSISRTPCTYIYATMGRYFSRRLSRINKTVALYNFLQHSTLNSHLSLLALKRPNVCSVDRPIRAVFVLTPWLAYITIRCISIILVEYTAKHRFKKLDTLAICLSRLSTDQVHNNSRFAPIDMVRFCIGLPSFHPVFTPSHTIARSKLITEATPYQYKRLW